ncbi:MAG: condensation domain-containing protein, partial [Cyanobacteria bacterium J06600_6]
MKTIDEFLIELYDRDVKFWIETKEDNEVKLRFNAPEEVLTPELITQLKERKPEIIEFLEQASAVKSHKSTIKPVSRSESLPLSFAQQRLWFMEQLQPDSAAYNIPTGVKLSGDLDLDLFAKSLNEIVRRHEVLRTNFETESGQPQQVIHSDIKLDLTVRDLQPLDAEAQEAEAAELFRQETAKAFDLKQDLLLRVT